jgi:hypothetical protein
MDDLDRAQRRIQQILSTHSWRLTRPLRFAAYLLRGDWRAIRAGLRPRLLRTAPAAYQHVPLNPVRKRRLAWLAYRVTGSLFEGSPGYEAWRIQPDRNPCKLLFSVGRSLIMKRRVTWAKSSPHAKIACVHIGIMK